MRLARTRTALAVGIVCAFLFSVIAGKGDGLYVPFSMPATTCSNQFIRTIAVATGVGACATVGSADLASSLALTTPNIGAATGTSLNLGGSTLSTYLAATAWTPADGSASSLTFTSVSANYGQIGNLVVAYGALTFPVTASGNTARIQGFPVATANQGYSRQCSLTYTDIAALVRVNMTQNATNMVLSTSTGTNLTNAQMSTGTIIFMCIYPAT